MQGFAAPRHKTPRPCILCAVLHPNSSRRTAPPGIKNNPVSSSYQRREPDCSRQNIIGEHMKLKAVLHDRLSRLAAIPLLTALAIPLIAWAQSQSVQPLAGVLGKIQSFNGSSLDVATASGVVHVTVKQPLATYKQVPSDLSHVTANTYVGR